MSLDDILGNTFLNPKAVDLSKEPNFNALIGPFLRFRGIENGIYLLSILIISKETPLIKIENYRYMHTILDSYKDYKFFCYYVDVTLQKDSQILEYVLEIKQNQQKYKINIPSVRENCRFAFYSCAGISKGEDSHILGGYSPLWQDLLQENKEKPIHLLIGGGDQLVV